MRRAVLASAAAGMAGAGALGMAAPAGADTLTTVMPSTGLKDGQAVSLVVDSGQPAGSLSQANLQVFECWSDGSGDVECVVLGDISYDATQSAQRNEDTWTGTVNVQKTVGSMTCQNQCYLGALDSQLNQIGTGPIPLSFK
jgi:hypothetical protein